MRFKKIAKGASKVLRTGAKAAVPIAYASKYQKQIATGAKYAAKGAKFLAKNSDKIQSAQKILGEHFSGGSFSVPGAVVDATLGIAKRKGEKYLDKKLGKYKAYRIAKAGFDTAWDVGTGNYAGALSNATDLYADVDPNKKRAAKVRGAIKGATGFYNSAMSGDVLGAYQNAGQVYTNVDPNKKRVAKFNRINSQYVNPALDFAQSANAASRASSKSSRVLQPRTASIIA